MPAIVRLSAWALLATLAWTAAAPGIDGTPGNTALGPRWIPALRFHDAQRNTPGLQQLLNQRSPALAALRELTGVDCWVLWSEPTWNARVVLVAAAPAADGQVSDPAQVALALEWLTAAHDLLGVDPSSLTLHRQKHIGALRLVQFRQHFLDVPVVPSNVTVTFTQLATQLVLTRIDCEGCSEEVQTQAALAPEDATRIARDWVGSARVTSSALPALVIVPARFAQEKAVQARLAYQFRMVTSNPVASYEVAVDAQTGAVIHCDDRIRYADLSGTVQGLATPGILPDSASNPPVTQALRGMTVSIPGAGTVVTALDGSFQIPHAGVTPLSMTLQLAGPYVNVNNQAGVDLSISTTIMPGVPLAVLANPATDGLTTAQVNGFLQTNVVHDYVKSVDPTWNDLDFPLPCNCNLNDVCNAYYDGSSINFFLPGSGCANTCYSSVVHHEYGHAVLDHITPFADGNYHEGVADVIATLLSNNPNIGLGMSGSGYIRNVDLQDRSFPQDLTQPIHTAGLIVGGAFWDLRTALIASMGPAPGLALARHLSIMHLYFQAGAISPVITIDVLTVDDDDGNLLNGTPHFPEINQAFSTHGLDGPDLVYATFQHTALTNTLNDLLDHQVVALVQGTVLPLAAVEIAYRTTSGGAFSFVTMTPSGLPGEYQGAFPAPPSPARVEYFLRATDTAGNSEFYPSAAPGSPLSYFVGQVTVIFEDAVGATDNGWTHVQVAQQDDWQRGAPNQRSPQFVNAWDPLVAYSAPNVWGNDLAPPPNWNGNYQSNASNTLESPPIDCSAHAGIWLEYQRWLTIESGQFDLAQVRVNNIPVFTNHTTVDHADTGWVKVAHDIASLADHNAAVRVRFSLTADPSLNFGGWNLDDIRLVSVTESNPEVFSFQAPQASVAPGIPMELHVLGRNDRPLTGYSIAGGIDPALCKVLSVSLTGTVAESFSPDFFGPQIGPTHYGAEVIIDFFMADTVPVGVDQRLLAIQYRVLPTVGVGTQVQLPLSDGSGSPPLSNLAYTGAGVVVPFLLDGGLTVSPPPVASFLRGDGNEDGALNLSDAIVTLLYIFAQGAAPACLDALDVNDDGAVHLGDVIYLLTYLFQQGPAPPPPWPAAGIDPTQDALLCSP